MSAYKRWIVRPKFYLDSVALMRFSKAVSALDGVSEAALMMATPANLDIMVNAGLLDSNNIDAGAGDLVISVSGTNEQLVNDAISAAQTLLDAPSSSSEGEVWRPKTIRSAVANNPAANFALISVPGPFAVSEARKAIRHGLHVMIFSDNVAIEKEVELKTEARELGKLVMGPDCGTAIINGVPLAFANKVPRGNIGIIGASGTGIQEVSCAIAHAGKGISQAIGVGGRDLSDAVGGISTLMAMDLLENDAGTAHVVLISKPPAANIVDKVLQKASQSKKSYTICFLGGIEVSMPDNCQWSSTLSHAAAMAVGGQIQNDNNQNKFSANKQKGKLVRGLFCGGTLCTEALVMFKQAGVAVTSNISMNDVGALNDSASHTLIDLGADEYTQGQPHPMIEPTIRDSFVKASLSDNAVGVLLVDLVIGYGAHADPASVFVKSLAANRQTNALIIASVTGTDADPQNRTKQIAILNQAGVVVADSNSSAVELALASIGVQI